MTARERLPNRRQCESFEFRHNGFVFTLSAGRFWDGRIAEIFLSSHRPGSPIEAIARDAAVTVSIALQFGVPLETIRLGLDERSRWIFRDLTWHCLGYTCEGGVTFEYRHTPGLAAAREGATAQTKE